MKQKKKLGIIIAIVAAVLVVGVMIFCTKAKWNKFTGRNVR